MFRRFAAAAFALLSPFAALADTTVDLGESLARWGYGSDTNKAETIGEWSRSGFKIRAEKDKAFLTLGGLRVWLNSGVSVDSPRLRLRRSDHDKTLVPILASGITAAPALRTIVIDPGHGGKDPGKQNGAQKIDEKTMTLDVSNRLKSILNAKGYRVLLTRTKDTFVGLDDRSAFANKNGADLFVSIHFNAAEDNSVTGTETYCLTPAGQFSTNDSKRGHAAPGAYVGNKYDDYNILLGYYVQQSIIGRLGSDDRGVRRARFAVLQDLKCPGILVESAFLSNNEECKRVGAPAYREKIAQALADGITNYAARVVKVAAANSKKKPGR